jgi:hypothetical protein
MHEVSFDQLVAELVVHLLCCDRVTAWKVHYSQSEGVSMEANSYLVEHRSLTAEQL